jgi:hypothetical protein
MDLRNSYSAILRCDDASAARLACSGHFRAKRPGWRQLLQRRRRPLWWNASPVLIVNRVPHTGQLLDHRSSVRPLVRTLRPMNSYSWSPTISLGSMALAISRTDQAWSSGSGCRWQRPVDRHSRPASHWCLHDQHVSRNIRGLQRPGGRQAGVAAHHWPRPASRTNGKATPRPQCCPEPRPAGPKAVMLRSQGCGSMRCSNAACSAWLWHATSQQPHRPERGRACRNPVRRLSSADT